MNHPIKLEGLMTAIVTPFAGGEVDYDAFGCLIDDQLARGVQGIVPCGTTGESPALSHDEHDRVVKFTVEKVANRAIVVAGSGSNSTVEALRLTRQAKKAGADACLVVNPYYNRPTQQGLFEHVSALGDADLPIVLYNHPGRTGIELHPETIIRMYEQIDMVVAVKDATGKIDTASQVAASCDMTILSGDDSLTLPLMSVGAKGVISVLSNLLPEQMRKLCDAALAGDYESAREQHLKLIPMFMATNIETNPIPIKAAMAMMGIVSTEMRLPMTKISDQNKPILAKALADFGMKIKQ